MMIDRRNAYRYPGKGSWFDFWNCRVVIPDEERWFFIMPHIITHNSEKKGFFFFCSSDHEVEVVEISDEIATSESNAHVQWGNNLFSFDKVYINQAGIAWDFAIDRLCTDGTDQEEEARVFNVREKLYLRNVSFIHRVPTMKGYASGTIDWKGEKIDLSKAIVYQAKNHGPDFPKFWTWIHANIIPQFPNASFELGLMPSKNGFDGLFRWAENGVTKVYTSFLGDNVILEKKDDNFVFAVKDSEGNLIIEGKAIHGSKKEIRFETPSGNVFSTPESFDGYVSGNYLGKFFESNFPALGKGTLEYK